MYADERLNRWTFFNPNENTKIETYSEFALMSKPEVSVRIDVENYTVGEILESEHGLHFDINTLTFDLSLMDASDRDLKKDFEKTVEGFYSGQSISLPELYKNTYIQIKGLEKKPDVVVCGDNGASARLAFQDGTANILIRSNGRVVVDIEYSL